MPTRSVICNDHEVTYHGRADTDIANFAETSDNLSSLNPDVVVNASAYTAVDKAETATESG